MVVLFGLFKLHRYTNVIQKDFKCSVLLVSLAEENTVTSFFQGKRQRWKKDTQAMVPSIYYLSLHILIQKERDHSDNHPFYTAAIKGAVYTARPG